MKVHAGTVSLPKTVYDEIVDDCRSSYPAEVCGLVGGTRAALRHVIPVPNVAEPEDGKCGFLMDGRAQLHAMREIEGCGLDLVAIYHSHPHSAPVPSEGDVRLAAYPDVAYVIVSTSEPASPELRAWRIDGTAVHELRVHITE